MLRSHSWIYFLFLISAHFHSSASNINKAPAKVTIRLQVSKLNQALANVSRLKICIDKVNERCFWSKNEEISWDGEQYKEISFTFLTANMATELFLEVQIEQANKKIDFPRKTINLLNMSSKTSFELHAYDLESFIRLAIEHECENGYYPPRQCTNVCYPMPKESDCDAFGNKICKEGLLFDKTVDRCIANNCLKSPVRCENGRCVNKASTFACVCLDSYVGKFCQLPNPCYPNPCYNGGVCHPGGDSRSFTCSCPPQFSDDRCLKKGKRKCTCPDNMQCIYSKTGSFLSCDPSVNENDSNMYENSVSNNRITAIKGRDSKANNEWSQVSLTTTVIAAVGCFMVILCIIVSLYVCYHTRELKMVRRDPNNPKSPSTMYTDFSPQVTETSFKRSLSLDDNSAYIPSNSQMFQILPNNFLLNSSNEYSLHRNPYQDTGPSSLRSFPVYEGIKFPREYTMTPTILHQDNTKCSSLSTTSGSSLPPPPVLPPRTNNLEITSSGTLPKAD